MLLFAARRLLCELCGFLAATANGVQRLTFTFSHDVLQPGVYYKNPRVEKVDVVPVGYDAINVHSYAQAEGYPPIASTTEPRALVWIP